MSTTTVTFNTALPDEAIDKFVEILRAESINVERSWNRLCVELHDLGLAQTTFVTTVLHLSGRPFTMVRR